MKADSSQTLRVRDACIALPERRLIRKLSLDIAAGQGAGVMGASGSGT